MLLCWRFWVSYRKFENSLTPDAANAAVAFPKEVVVGVWALGFPV
jgi:hypothetical protein